MMDLQHSMGDDRVHIHGGQSAQLLHQLWSATLFTATLLGVLWSHCDHVSILVLNAKLSTKAELWLQKEIGENVYLRVICCRNLFYL